jgi:hypothetical protein
MESLMVAGNRAVVYFCYVGHWLPIINCLCYLATGTMDRVPSSRSSNSAEWVEWVRLLVLSRILKAVDRIS